MTFNRYWACLNSGISCYRLGRETSPRWVYTLPRIIDQVEDKERVGVCLGTCHALAAGYDFRTEEGYEAMMAGLEETVGIMSVGCWHFKDMRWDGVPMLLETPRKEDGDGKDLQNLRALAALVTDVNRLPEGLRPSP